VRYREVKGAPPRQTYVRYVVLSSPNPREAGPKIGEFTRTHRSVGEERRVRFEDHRRRRQAALSDLVCTGPTLELNETGGGINLREKSRLGLTHSEKCLKTVYKKKGEIKRHDPYGLKLMVRKKRCVGVPSTVANDKRRHAVVEEVKIAIPRTSVG